MLLMAAKCMLVGVILQSSSHCLTCSFLLAHSLSTAESATPCSSSSSRVEWLSNKDKQLSMQLKRDSDGRQGDLRTANRLQPRQKHSNPPVVELCQ